DLKEQIEEYKSDIIIYKSKFKNDAALKNFGFKKSSGEVLSFFNIDDINGKMRFELGIKRFGENPKTGMVFCSTTYINSAGEFLNGVSKFPDYSANRFIGSMFEQNRINTISTTLIRTSIFRRTGGFDEKLKRGEDFDLFLKIGKVSKVEYIDLPLMRYRPAIYPLQSGVEKFQYGDDEIEVLKKFDLGDIAAALSFLYDKETDFRFSFGMILYRLGRVSEAMLNFDKSGKLDPENCETLFYSGNCSLKLKDYESALNEYKKCLKINPEHVECLNNMGVVYNLMGDDNKSKAKLKKAFKLNGKLIESLYDPGMTGKGGKAEKVCVPLL
ncbi:tetratricopeptide repeat protein, partial [candidate division KSB1 bacterium]